MAASSYEIDHNWGSWCRLPSFASIHSYRMAAASFMRRGYCLSVEVNCYERVPCDMCLCLSMTHARINTRPICRTCDDAIATCLLPRYTFNKEFAPYDTLTNLPIVWHDPQLPAMLDRAAATWMTARLCSRADPFPCMSCCDICCTRGDVCWVAFDVSMCNECISRAQPHVDAFHRKVLLLHNIGMLPEVIRTILDMFVQLHALWDNLNVVPYA